MSLYHRSLHLSGARGMKLLACACSVVIFVVTLLLLSSNQDISMASTPPDQAPEGGEDVKPNYAVVAGEKDAQNTVLCPNLSCCTEPFQVLSFRYNYWARAVAAGWLDRLFGVRSVHFTVRSIVQIRKQRLNNTFYHDLFIIQYEVCSCCKPG